jgi:hypothetical protein
MWKMADSSVLVPHEPEMRRTIVQRVSIVTVIATLIWSDL